MDAGRQRWLVTGAGGQLGRSFLAAARERGVHALGLARAQLDVRDEAAVDAALSEHAPDVVLNAAAFTAVDAAEGELEAARRTNAEAVGILARRCAGRALLIHVSTDYVFAGEPGRQYGEDAPPAPLQAYGRSKLEGEQAVRAAGGEHLVVRTQWLFGPGENFVRAILARAKQGAALRVVTDEVGRPTWTGSLASALLEVAQRPLRGTLHLANRGVTSRYEFAREIVGEGFRRGWIPEVAVEAIASTDLDLPAARPAHAVLDLARASQAGLELCHWRVALARYLDAVEEGRDG